MDFPAVLRSNFNLQSLAYAGARVIFIAVVFELAAWWLGRRIERLTSPLITADANREANWRIRRRTAIRQSPKVLTRTLCYAAAIIAVLNVFETNLPLLSIPVMPLAIVVGALCLIIGLAFLPLLRDMMQGYALLAEDTMAVGDVVAIDGHQGVIEKMTLRGVWLRDSNGYTHCLSNRGVTNVVVQQRRLEDRKATEAPSAATPPPNRQRG